ncbi:MAG: YciI family protein [Bacteroidota bacterium]
MNEFMMIFRHVPVADYVPSPEAIQESIKTWQDWIGGIAAQGKFVSTNQLSDVGKTVMPDKVVTDGPYAEIKEIVGGYMIVKAEQMDEAIEMAKGCPIFSYGGHVEVRLINEIPS